MAGLLLAGCQKKEAATPAATNTTSSTSGGNPLTAPADYLGAAAKAKKTSEKTVDTVAIQQAINLFNAQEGRFPKDLNELVSPDYLSKLPPPPHGMKFDYNPATGVFKVVPQ